MMLAAETAAGSGASPGLHDQPSERAKVVRASTAMLLGTAATSPRAARPSSITETEPSRLHSPSRKL